LFWSISSSISASFTFESAPTLTAAAAAAQVCADAQLSAGPHLVYATFYKDQAWAGVAATWSGPDTGGSPAPIPSQSGEPVNFAPGGCARLDGVWADPSGARATIAGAAGRWEDGRPDFAVQRAAAGGCNAFDFKLPDGQTVAVAAAPDGVTLAQSTAAGVSVGKWVRVS
jgi:hypothetical protein